MRRIAPLSWTLPGWRRMADVRDGPLYRKENLVLNVDGETVHIDCPERLRGCWMTNWVEMRLTISGTR